MLGYLYIQFFFILNNFLTKKHFLSKKFFHLKFFWSQFFLPKNFNPIFFTKFFLDPKTFLINIFLTHKCFFDLTRFLVQEIKNLGSQNFRPQKIFGAQKLFVLENFGPEIFASWKNIVSWKKLCPEKIFGP